MTKLYRRYLRRYWRHTRLAVAINALIFALFLLTLSALVGYAYGAREVYQLKTQSVTLEQADQIDRDGFRSGWYQACLELARLDEAYCYASARETTLGQ